MNEHEAILTSLLRCSRSDLYTKDVALTEQQQRAFDTMVKRYHQGEPLQYIIGFTNFMGIDLDVNPHVLIPRPETEILAEKALSLLKDYGSKSLTVLDVGTGSGNIAIALAHYHKNCRVIALDCSKEALEVARRNAQKNQCADRVSFIHKDMRGYFARARMERFTFDMIISNPPYIKEEDIKNLPRDVQQEPLAALHGGTDGLDYIRFILEEAHGLLRPEGVVLLEIGDGQKDAVAKILEGRAHYQPPTFVKDYTNVYRIAIVKKAG